jgi:hypothetical protein
MRDDSVPVYAAGSGGKRGVSQPVRLFEGTIEERREDKYVARALKAVPRGTSVFNWPCGCGRLLPLLKKLGYHVTSSNSSSYVVARMRLSSQSAASLWFNLTHRRETRKEKSGLKVFLKPHTFCYSRLPYLFVSKDPGHIS